MCSELCDQSSAFVLDPPGCDPKRFERFFSFWERDFHKHRLRCRRYLAGDGVGPWFCFGFEDDSEVLASPRVVIEGSNLKLNELCDHGADHVSDRFWTLLDRHDVVHWSFEVCERKDVRVRFDGERERG